MLYCFQSRSLSPPSTAFEAPALRFHESLPGYRRTPLLSLPGLAKKLGLRALYIKDEGRRLGLKSFKVLGASYAIHSVLQKTPGVRGLATATDGNYGHAVAWMAKGLGIPCYVYMPIVSAPARVDAIRREGAETILVRGTFDDAVRQCGDEAHARNWQVVSDTGYPGYEETPQLIADGYATLFEELDRQLCESRFPSPDFLVVQCGVGGLASAAVRYAWGMARRPAVFTVEPEQAACVLPSIAAAGSEAVPAQGTLDSAMAGLNCGRVSTAAWPILRVGVNLSLAIGDTWAEQAMRLLYNPLPGDPVVESGESGAAGLAGLLALMTDSRYSLAKEASGIGSDKTVLLLNTEGVTDPVNFARVAGTLCASELPGEAS
jgi:diaminopropionate ammonia-lyase